MIKIWNDKNILSFLSCKGINKNYNFLRLEVLLLFRVNKFIGFILK